jgi:hypothetical protein
MIPAAVGFVAGFLVRSVIDRIHHGIRRRRVLARLQNILTFESQREQDLRIARLPD